MSTVAGVRPSAQTAHRTTLSMLLLGAYVFLLPVQLPLQIANFAPSDIFLALWLFAEMGRVRVRLQTWSIWHLGLIGVFLLGTWIAVLNHGGFTTYLLVKNLGLAVVFLGYLFVTSAVDSWEDIRFLLRTFVFATSLHCAISLAGYFAQVRTPWLNYGYDRHSNAAERLSGMLLDPNAFGGLVMVALVLHCITFASSRPLWKGIPGVLMGALLSFALLLTLSRSAWIALGFAFVTVTLFRPRLVFVYAVVAVVGLAVAYVAAGRRGAQVAAVADRPRTTQQRLDQIREAWPLIVQNPIIGTGLGGFDDAEKNNPMVDHPYVIHNTTVWILTEFGLIGVTAFAGLLIWVIRAGKSALRLASDADRSIIIALISAHVGMFGLSTGIEAFYQRHWWMVMALVASAYAMRRVEPALQPEIITVHEPANATRRRFRA